MQGITGNSPFFILKFDMFPESHSCINKHPAGTRWPLLPRAWKNKTSASAPSSGTAGTLAAVLHLLYRHALSLFSSLRRRLKIPIMRSSSWGEDLFSPSVSFIHSYLLGVAHSAPLYYLTSPHNITRLFASASSLPHHASCSLSWLHKNNKNSCLQRCVRVCVCAALCVSIRRFEAADTREIFARKTLVLSHIYTRNT